MLKKEKNRVYIVLPAYNEAANLRGLVYNVNNILTDTGIVYTLIVVNDGSSDSSAEVIKELSKDYPIILINHEKNMGIGAVFTNGLKKASELAEEGDIIVIMEADCTNEPLVITSMLAACKENYDVVIGSRYKKGGGYYDFPLFRRILSICANNMLRLFFYIPGIRDYTIFFRAYRADIIKKAFFIYKENFITTNTFVANAEILVKLRNMGIKVCEKPLIYNYSKKKSKSNMKIAKTIVEYLRFIIVQILNR